MCIAPPFCGLRRVEGWKDRIYRCADVEVACLVSAWLIDALANVCIPFVLLHGLESWRSVLCPLTT